MRSFTSWRKFYGSVTKFSNWVGLLKLDLSLKGVFYGLIVKIDTSQFTITRGKVGQKDRTKKYSKSKSIGLFESNNCTLH